MAAVVTLLGTATFDTSSGTHTVTATPAADDLIVIVTGHTGYTGTTAPTDNNSDGLGTYALAQSNVKATSADTLQFWVRNGLVGSATSTVFTMAPGATSGGGLVVLKVTGMARVGLAAIAHAGGQNNQATSTTPTPVLSGAAATANAVISALFNATNGITTAQRTGYTVLATGGYNTPATGLRVISLNSGETSSSLAWGGASASAFASAAIELDIGAAKSDISTLSEGFGTTLNGAVWSSAAPSGTSNTVAGGVLQLDVTNVSLAPGYANITSISGFSLVGSSIYAAMLQPLGVLNGSETLLRLQLSTDGSTFMDWLYTAPSAGGASQMTARVVVASVQTTPYSANYDATAYYWLRIRESAGTLFWDTAPFGATNPPSSGDWVNRGSVSSWTAPGLGSMQAVLLAGADVNTASSSTGPAKWDGLNTNIASVGASAGIGAASGAGASTASALGSAAGTGTASGAGKSTAASAGSSTGIGTASGTGASTASSPGSSAGIGAASGVGASTAAAAGAVAGIGAGIGVGASTAAAAGASAGVGAADGVSQSPFSSADGAASGTGAASGVGASTAAATGAAAGVGTASGVGAFTAAADGASAGLGAAAATGTSTAQASGASAGSAAATAAGQSTAESGGASASLGDASAGGQSTAAGDGACAGAAIAAAAGTGIAVTDGTAAGTGTASGVGQISTTNDGLASGLGAAFGIGESTALADGSSAGMSLVQATGESTAATSGAAFGLADAQAGGLSTGEGDGDSAGLADAQAAGESTASADGSASEISGAVAVGACTATATGLAHGTCEAFGAGFSWKALADHEAMLSALSERTEVYATSVFNEARAQSRREELTVTTMAPVGVVTSEAGEHTSTQRHGETELTTP